MTVNEAYDGTPARKSEKVTTTHGRLGCLTCNWYVADATEAVDEVSVSATGELMIQKSRGIGQCHCAAPIFGDWPTVFADDFCGDWECRGNE